MTEKDKRTRNSRNQERKPRKDGSSFRDFRVFISAPSAFSYFGMLAITGVWLAAICAAPMLVAGGRVLAGTTLYAAFAAICHQRAERSFHLDGLPFAVCARCFGIYAGFAVGMMVYPLVRRLDNERMPARRWLLLAVAPMVIDFSLGVTGLIENTHLSRVLTGALAGAWAAFYIIPGLVSTFTTWLYNLNAQRPQATPAFPGDYSRRTPDHE